MKINGKGYSRDELLMRNNPSAIYDAQKIVLTDGRGKGHRLIDVKTAAGLAFTLSEDKCLDIFNLTFKGINMAYITKNGLINTPIANPDVDSFAKYWPAGFLTTCGLRNTGPACRVNDEFFPIHGNVHLMPAEHVNIDITEEMITITGNVYETSVFGHNLQMQRKITVPSDGSTLTVHDTINNLTPEDEYIFMLYHINFGFPFLCEDLKLDLPKGQIKGRTPHAQERINNHTEITKPIKGEPESVFFHMADAKNAQATLTNKPLGIGATVKYDTAALPILSQWKSMRAGDYALGIEPSTSTIKGRKEELEEGYNIKVQGFGKIEYGFTIDFFLL